jgi:hypothetical protein
LVVHVIWQTKHERISTEEDICVSARSALVLRKREEKTKTITVRKKRYTIDPMHRFHIGKDATPARTRGERKLDVRSSDSETLGSRRR